MKILKKLFRMIPFVQTGAKEVSPEEMKKLKKHYEEMARKNPTSTPKH